MNYKKCVFFQDRINYLGHTISKEGLSRDENKVKAIIDAPRPNNVTEVRAFVGMCNYYAKFVPRLSEILNPLYDLVKKNTVFRWTRETEESMRLAKKKLASSEVLVHYDPQKQVRLACDASQKGIGAVLMHVLDNGQERPIAYCSRILSKAEANYSMIHKEALAIYWGVNKFYQYLAGKKFELVTDHKPLLALFGEDKTLPQMAAGRLQRWSLFLANFDYTIKYLKGVENVHADALSRLPLKEEAEAESEQERCCQLNFVEDSTALDLNALRVQTRKDAITGQVMNFIRYGFPSISDNVHLTPYVNRKDELYIEEGVIMWGYRVIIPTKFQDKLLQELHSSHMGMAKMKSTARSYFWWPKLDKDIEDYIRNCKVCACNRPEPRKAPLKPWSKAGKAYERVHADFLGPFANKMMLVITDAYSKWPEVFIMNGTEADVTVRKFRECFARFGIPNSIVTDNGPQFTSKVFMEFCSQNGIRHITSPPFHPATNGAAENCVKSVKSGIGKALSDSRNKGVALETLLQRYLFSYRNAEHSTTGMTPAQLIFNYKPKTRMDLLRHGKERSEQEKKGRKGREAQFQEDEVVYCRDYRNPNKKQWKECTIEEVLGEQTYLCKVRDEELVWKRHTNQIHKGAVGGTRETGGGEVQINKENTSATQERRLPEVSKPTNQASESLEEMQISVPEEESVDQEERGIEMEIQGSQECAEERTRPRRNIRPPQRLNL